MEKTFSNKYAGLVTSHLLYTEIFDSNRLIYIFFHITCEKESVINYENGRVIGAELGLGDLGIGRIGKFASPTPLCMIFTILLTLSNTEQKNGL